MKGNSVNMINHNTVSSEQYTTDISHCYGNHEKRWETIEGKGFDYAITEDDSTSRVSSSTGNSTIKEKDLLLIRFQRELEEKQKIIESMQTTQKTLEQLIEDKNTVIETQNTLFDILRNKSRVSSIIKEEGWSEDLEEAKKEIATKENELQSYKMEMKNLKDKLRLLVPENWL